ncbi:hypothetical protein [Paenibacillus sp. OV219]|uniref:hypothetical protein n=1 Tax=Paenibacillus sp. OV219 TaxID=1884377 RepID=UPI000B897DD4|nr:hypothetical protein [Paenibacillus sp. OV219]
MAAVLFSFTLTEDSSIVSRITFMHRNLRNSAFRRRGGIVVNSQRDEVHKIHKIIAEWDPYNSKIYGIESYEILKYIRSSGSRDPEQIAGFIEAMLGHLDPSRKLNKSECLLIAKKIIVILE